MNHEQNEWCKVYKNRCEASLRIVYADWLEERGRCDEAVGWRILAYVEPRYKPLRKTRNKFIWYNGGSDCCGDDELPKKWYKALRGYKKKVFSLFSSFKSYASKRDAMDAFAMAIGKCCHNR